MDETREMSVAAQAAIEGESAFVIVGDINIDFDLWKNSPQRRFWTGQLLKYGYIPVFPQGGNTMLTNINQATPANYSRNLLLDNCFVRYNPTYEEGDEFPFETNTQVIDRVVGDQAFPTVMANDLPLINTLGNEDEINSTFRLPRNYGRIAAFAGISDHLPLVVNI
ncbi:MAG: hypothetical protein AAF492_29525 [Verrucomicrobiota bacterium]